MENMVELYKQEIESMKCMLPIADSNQKKKIKAYIEKRKKQITKLERR